MQTLGRRAATHPLVNSWAFEPNSFSPRSLVISLDSAAYPEAVQAVRLDIHWFVTDNYYIHYVETRGASHFQCRWDRHPKTDAPRVNPPRDQAPGLPASTTRFASTASR